MNLKNYSAALFAFVLFFSSCKKDSGKTDSNVKADGETPLASIVTNDTIINSKTAYGQSGGAEIGYRLHFLLGGTISQLGANMASTGTYVVSFWRTSDTALLGRTNVTVSDTSKFAYANVTSFDVKPDTSYSVSIHISDGASQSHWIYTWTPFHDLYPITQGNVVVDQALDLAYLPVGGGPQYPITVYSSDQAYVGSSCDIVFKASK